MRDLIVSYVRTFEGAEHEEFYKIWEAICLRDNIPLHIFDNGERMLHYPTALNEVYVTLQSEAKHILLVDHDFVPNPTVDWTGRSLIEDKAAVACMYKHYLTEFPEMAGSWFTLLDTEKVPELDARWWAWTPLPRWSLPAEDTMNWLPAQYDTVLLPSKGVGLGVEYATGRHLHFSRYLTYPPHRRKHIPRDVNPNAVAREMIDEFWSRFE